MEFCRSMRDAPRHVVCLADETSSFVIPAGKKTSFPADFRFAQMSLRDSFTCTCEQCQSAQATHDNCCYRVADRPHSSRTMPGRK
jgi:hypothetical protein